jgi:peptidylprolyl isomerase
MSEVKAGDKVKIDFSGQTQDGHEFIPKEAPQTVEFTVGGNEVIKGLSEAVLGMKPGESRTVELAMEDAFGPYNKDMVAELDRKVIPAEQHVEEGQHLELHRADGLKIPAVILEVTDETIRVDANHPLAGRDLTLEVKLLEVA